MSMCKVHLIGEQHPNSDRIKTVCGREASLCRGWSPRPGAPGEYDTAICNRISATPYREDVTCKRCLRQSGADERGETA